MRSHQFSLRQLAILVTVWCALWAMVASEDFANLVVLAALFALFVFVPLYAFHCWWRNYPRW